MTASNDNDITNDDTRNADFIIGSDPVARAIRDIAAGRIVVVADDEGRENEGDLICATPPPAISHSWPRTDAD